MTYKIDIEQLRADMAAGTDGPWSAFEDDTKPHTNIVSAYPKTQCVLSLSGRRKDNPDIRRIARLPDLEAAYLELREAADALADAADEVAGTEQITQSAWDEYKKALTNYKILTNT